MDNTCQRGSLNRQQVVKASFPSSECGAEDQFSYRIRDSKKHRNCTVEPTGKDHSVKNSGQWEYFWEQNMQHGSVLIVPHGLCRQPCWCIKPSPAKSVRLPGQSLRLANHLFQETLLPGKLPLTCDGGSTLKSPHYCCYTWVLIIHLYK